MNPLTPIGYFAEEHLGPPGGLETYSKQDKPRPLWYQFAETKVKLRENETDWLCRQLACNRTVVISSLLISQHQLELSICLLKVNCLHTHEAHVSHAPQSLQHAVACL